jgi:peptidoglycan/xylan/chitin deacetylase (PgdA/CDA1 family)
MDDDKPYLLDTPSGRLAELPPQWYLDDGEQYLFLPYPGFDRVIQRPSAVADTWKDEVDAYRAIHSLLVLTAHPCLSGRPARVRALEGVIEYAESLGDVEFARCDEVAARLLETPERDLLQSRPGE